MIAVVFALGFEAGASRQLSGSTRTIILGRAGASSAGALEAALSTGRKPSAVISAGLAGGLDPTLETGDLVLATHPASGALLEKAMCIERPPWRLGTLHTVGALVRSAGEKDALHRKTGASICDMESAHIFEVCSTHGIPFITLRAISDPAGVDLPEIALLDPSTGRPATGRLLLELAAHPRRIRPFAAMVLAAHTARSQLARGLDVLLPALNEA